MSKHMLWIKHVLSGNCGMPFIFPNRMRGSRDIISYDFKKFLLMKDAINSVKFPCFDKGGKCHNVSPDARCCCSSCAYEGGHFEPTDLILEKDIPMYNSLFKRTYGFWVKGKGCVLPREHRSLTCISYNCEHDKSIGTMVRAVQNEANAISKRIRLECTTYLTRHIMDGKIKRKGYKLLPED